MPRIVRFGSASPKLYTFPDTLQSLSGNFGNVVPITTRMPGMSGGLDEYGDDAAPSEIGNIQLTYKLIASSRDQMTAKRDVVNQMLEWGTQRLYMQPTDPLLSERWTRARINNISMSQDLAKHSDLWQDVSISFQCSDPRWYAAGTESPSWGDNTITWGGGAKWGGSLSPTTLTGGVVSNITVTNNGKMITRPRLTFVYVSGTPTPVFSIVRYVGGVAVESLGCTLSTALTTNETLEINPRAYSVLRYTSGIASDAYYGLQFTHPDWLRLDPGANTIQLFCGSGTYDCYIRYYEVYA